jgi:hypothetical protein
MWLMRVCMRACVGGSAGALVGWDFGVSFAAYATNPQTKALLDLLDLPDKFHAAFVPSVPGAPPPPRPTVSFSASAAAAATATAPASLVALFQNFETSARAAVVNPEEIELE